MRKFEVTFLKAPAIKPMRSHPAQTLTQIWLSETAEFKIPVPAGYLCLAIHEIDEEPHLYCGELKIVNNESKD